MTLTHAYDEPHKPARVVVLGGSGFLGSRFLHACAAAGIAATGLGSGDVDLAEPGAQGQLAGRLRPGDVLMFLAALTPDKGRNSAALMRNLAICRAVCAATHQVELEHLVYASSDAVYPFAVTLISEETPAAASDLYGAMHRARELVLAGEAKAPLAVIRMAALYGPGDTHNSYGPNRFLRQALEDGRIVLFGDGEEMRDHVHVDDAAELMLRVVLHGSTGLINAATGKSVSFRSVAETIAARVPRAVAIAPSPRRNPITHRHFDITNAIRAFPELRLRTVEEGLAASLSELGATAHG
jgi:UDP-glucose 4-epimerase